MCMLVPYVLHDHPVQANEIQENSSAIKSTPTKGFGDIVRNV